MTFNGTEYKQGWTKTYVQRGSAYDVDMSPQCYRVVDLVCSEEQIGENRNNSGYDLGYHHEKKDEFFIKGKQIGIAHVRRLQTELFFLQVVGISHEKRNSQNHEEDHVVHQGVIESNPENIQTVVEMQGQPYYKGYNKTEQNNEQKILSNFMNLVQTENVVASAAQIFPHECTAVAVDYLQTGSHGHDTDVHAAIVNIRKDIAKGCTENTRKSVYQRQNKGQYAVWTYFRGWRQPEIINERNGDGEVKKTAGKHNRNFMSQV